MILNPTSYLPANLNHFCRSGFMYHLIIPPVYITVVSIRPH